MLEIMGKQMFKKNCLSISVPIYVRGNIKLRLKIYIFFLNFSPTMYNICTYVCLNSELTNMKLAGLFLSQIDDSP